MGDESSKVTPVMPLSMVRGRCVLNHGISTIDHCGVCQHGKAMMPPRDVVTRQSADIVAVDAPEASFSGVFLIADELRLSDRPNGVRPAKTCQSVLSD
jgi:hypothetical protein